MAFRDEKIVDVLRDEARKMDPRCEGYAELIADAVDNVIRFERAHIFRKSNIVQEISDVIEGVARVIDTKTSETGEPS